ncbi:MAG: PD-(D/E)XK nuclease family protein [Candidatus Aminicenantes bacterium]|nr:PD-(D/E)XK nuclease family protein [Candidatus Aminicenantes bacterium]
MPLPRGYISHSQIRTYKECPQKYYYAYIEGIKPPINEKVFLGEMFHAAIEKYFTLKINGTPLDDDSAAAAFSTAFDAACQEREIKWQTPRRETKERGQAFLQYFMRHIAPAVKPLMVEKELSVEIPGIDVVLKGVIDLVEEDFSITDFKTTTSKWSPSKARNSSQMVIYKYLFDRSFGPVQACLKYEVLYAKNAANVRHQTFFIVPAPDAVEKLLQMIGHVVENINGGVFYANENPFCRYCEFSGLCRKTKSP